MTNLSNSIVNEVAKLSEKQKEGVLSYIQSLKPPAKGNNPFKDFCKDDPELLEQVLNDVIESRNKRRCLAQRQNNE